MLMRLADRAFRPPPPVELMRYLGPHEGCYLGYATDEATRARAASGGVTSALLIHLLARHDIQGAIISRLTVEEGHIAATPVIARSPEEILAGQSSIYMDFPWLAGALDLVDSAEGEVAVVGLPCQMRALRRMEARRPDRAQKIAAHISLICGRSSSKALLLHVLAQKGVQEEEIANLRFREGHWRGQMHVWLKDGSERQFPFTDFSVYRNLHFFCEPRCLYCDDPLGEEADIVLGDAWLPEMKDDPVKHTLVIARSRAANTWIRDMMAAGSLTAREVSAETVFRAQRRCLIPAKRGQQAKAHLARLFRYPERESPAWRSRWNDYLTASIVFLNYRWTRHTRWATLIFRVPKALLKSALGLLSLLKHF